MYFCFRKMTLRLVSGFHLHQMPTSLLFGSNKKKKICFWNLLTFSGRQNILDFIRIKHIWLFFFLESSLASGSAIFLPAVISLWTFLDGNGWLWKQQSNKKYSIVWIVVIQILNTFFLTFFPDQHSQLTLILYNFDVMVK